jgi:SNF2 family DNA or RNA helicase
VIVNGRITGHRRERALHTFKTSKKCRLFIANIQAAGTGIDGLQKVCQSMAIVELGWTPTEHTQTEDRLWRLGQDDRVDINYLIAAGTIEEDIAAILYNRQKILDAVIDGRNLSKAEERALNDFDIFVELAKAYKAKKKRK